MPFDFDPNLRKTPYPAMDPLAMAAAAPAAPVQAPQAPTGMGQDGGGGGLGGLKPGGPMSGLGLLADLALGKHQTSVDPGKVVGQAPPGMAGAGDQITSMPQIHPDEQGARQGGLLEGLSHGMLNASGAGPLLGLAGMAGKKLGIPGLGDAGGVVGGLASKLGRFF